MTKVYTLTKKLRKRLAKPFGMIFKEPEAARNVHKYLKENRTKLLISVGDMTSENLIDYGRFPDNRRNNRSCSDYRYYCLVS